MAYAMSVSGHFDHRHPATAKGADVSRLARKRAPSPRCLFCHAQTERDLWDFPVCEPCTAMFWAFVERMLASGERVRCDGCGDPAGKIVDGRLLCGDCYAPVANAVSDAMQMLALRRTPDQTLAPPDS